MAQRSQSESEHADAALEREPVREVAEEARAADAAKQPKVQLLVDREATFGEARCWREFAVGHAWIRLIKADGSVDSWGYWPDLWSGHGVDTSAPWKSVPGKVLHPDDQHSPNGVMTTSISQEKADAVEKAANAKEASPGMYNLFTYNCTTFATDLAKLAGAPVPSFSMLGIANPNALFAGVESANKARELTPMETPLPPEN